MVGREEFYIYCPRIEYSPFTGTGLFGPYLGLFPYSRYDVLG